MPTSRIARGEIVDVSDFKQFAKVLRRTAPESTKRLRKGLRYAGGFASERVKANASFSKRIPGSVKVRTNGLTVSVIAGGDAAPNAAPIENHGKGHVRHPVFGRDVWTDKNSHGAWFTPGVHESLPVFAHVASDVLNDTVREVVRGMEGGL